MDVACGFPVLMASDRSHRYTLRIPPSPRPFWHGSTRGPSASGNWPTAPRCQKLSSSSRLAVWKSSKA